MQFDALDFFEHEITIIKTILLSIGYKPINFHGSDGYFPRVGSESQAGGNEGQQILPSSLPATINFN